MQTINTPGTFRSFKLLGISVLTAALIMCGMPFAAAYAVTSEEKFAEAESIIQKIDGLQTDLNAAQEDYDVALAEYDTATAAMEEAQKRIKEAEERIAELQERLGSRASSMYKSGGQSAFLEVLLGASSFSEFLTSWDMIEKISGQDAELVQETKDVREEADDARKEHEKQKEIAAQKMQEAEDLKNQIEATQASLQAEADKITDEAMELQAQEELEAEQARLAAEAAERAQNQINSGRPGGGSAGSGVIVGNGQFAHPCPNSYVSSTFGWRDFNGGSYHQGQDFAASEGTPYYAAESGTVLYATYNGGFNGGAGNWVVIAHGGGLVTKYMHSSQVFVSPGQQVSKGANIGTVGNTGNSFGAHLHFQVELNGTAVDPRNYL